VYEVRRGRRRVDFAIGRGILFHCLGKGRGGRSSGCDVLFLSLLFDIVLLLRVVMQISGDEDEVLIGM
jgi:hypothetical protein